mmetsp:Transcript_18415/g.42171  ORF Transcript_18415/g.42171 Transcript_18415/m.42171 type:complete len:93 (-) Transcript_18415:978-1256(-)
MTETIIHNFIYFKHNENTKFTSSDLAFFPAMNLFDRVPLLFYACTLRTCSHHAVTAFLISSDVVGMLNIPKVCSKAAFWPSIEVAAQQSFNV